MKKATHQQTKEHNSNLVLATIFEHSSVSRAEIARITSLTRTTVSDIVADLIAEGLVQEIGLGPSLGGKSPILLSLVEDARFLIGLDLGRTEFNGAVVNLRGQIKKRSRVAVNGFSGEQALGAVYDLLDDLLAGDLEPVVGIGVGVPGLVNTAEGTVVTTVNFDWQNLPLEFLLQEKYNLPIYILNDSQLAAMGEFLYGAVYGEDENLIVVNVRHGIGAGIIINGSLFQGDGGAAGEIGHINAVQEGGIPCSCGNRGCLETVASAQAIMRRAHLLSGWDQAVTLEGIERAFFEGDVGARQLVLEAGKYLGIAIGSLSGTLNIQTIVLSGELTDFGSEWLDAIREGVAHSVLPKLGRQCQVEIGKLGRDGVILGASAVMLKDYSLLRQHELAASAG